jgi:signal transduction histidine kinase
MSPAELTDYLDQLVSNGLKMSRIIDSLLLLAGVRRKETVNLSPLDMGKIITEVRQRLKPMIETYQPHLSFPTEWPAAVGYAPWVEEVWVNYLSNALKYGGHPPIIELGGAAFEHGMVRYWIKDNGPALPPSLRRVVYPFTKPIRPTRMDMAWAYHCPADCEKHWAEMWG